MVGAVVKAAVKKVSTAAIKSSEINMAKKFLESYGFRLPKDYKAQIKNIKIDPLGGSRLGQIKTELARMSSIRIGVEGRSSKSIKLMGDFAVDALRAIQAENLRRQSVTRAKRKDSIMVPDAKNAGKLVPQTSIRDNKDIPTIFVPKTMTDVELAAKLRKTAEVTTVDQEYYNKAELFRDNMIKGYINGAAGREIETLLTNKVNSMSNREMQQLAADMQRGKIRNIRTIDDLYEGIGNNHIGAIIGLLDAFGFGFDDLNDAQKNEIALITDTPYSVNPDGSYDWHNVKQAFDNY